MLPMKDTQFVARVDDSILRKTVLRNDRRIRTKVPEFEELVSNRGPQVLLDRGLRNNWLDIVDVDVRMEVKVVLHLGWFEQARALKF